MAGDAKANINENIKKANIDYLKSTTFIKYYLPFFKLGLNADELHTLNLIFSFEADNKIYIGSSKYLCDMLNYSKPRALRILKSLTDKGYLKKEASNGRINSIYKINHMFLYQQIKNNENYSQLADNKQLQNVTVNSNDLLPNKNIYKNNNKNIYAHLENEQVYNHEDDKQKEDDNHSSNIIKQDTKNKAIKKQNKELNELQEKQFDKFWQAYPKKVSKKEAQKSWNKINPSLELFEKILKALEIVKQTGQWNTDNGKFIPYPATWLNQERWTDEIKMMQDIKPVIEPKLKIKPVYENMLENDF
ncbi:MarR family transcriptional regulator [Megamonas funiformis]|uniref:MarR family transcriptional regulator n=1 Tax=Megamonas funiformis TaxID=437897 RepID=UPI0022E49A11|nr:helix-turn-helix domain-containing protein [Megamonas funiformis]